MRRSLQDIAGMVRNIPYPHPLPAELVPYHTYVADGGHCLCAIPREILPPMPSADKLWMYEVPIPVKYVLHIGYTWMVGDQEKFLLVDVPYSNELGSMVPDGFDEFSTP
ncbi:MAG: hypothetical protein LLF96_04190 [Eubacteriales bacterium]|nr:hypothetical protein [Eubacteriales bacterium]